MYGAVCCPRSSDDWLGQWQVFWLAVSADGLPNKMSVAIDSCLKQDLSAPVRLHTAAGLSEILTPFPFNHAFPCEPIAKCKGKIKKVKDKEKNGF